MTIGRDPLADIVIDDPEISRQHSRLTLTDSGYQIQDLGSTNGTYVDGKRLSGETVTLSNGQIVMVGSNVTLVYEVISAAADPMATMVAPAGMAGMPFMPPATPEPEPLPEPEPMAPPAADATALFYEPTPSPEPEPFPSFEPEPVIDSQPLPSFDEGSSAPLPTFDSGSTSSSLPFDSGSSAASSSGGSSGGIGGMLNGPNRNIIIGVTVLVVLCCCCLSLVAGLYATGVIG
jgi:predicted component of type VI protein secretion system